MTHPISEYLTALNDHHRKATMPEPRFARPFVLQRDRDISGVSGTGLVADGVLWPDGTVSIRWTGPMPSTVFWHSLANALHVHGHGGATRVVWADAPADAPLSRLYSHEECGFHWHGRDGLDIPMRDGQPICPRCELVRLTPVSVPTDAALHSAISRLFASEQELTATRRRAEIAEAELEALRGGIRATGGDPTTVQNVYAQLASRTRQWKEAQTVNAEAQQVIDMQKELIGTERRIVMTAMDHRESNGARITHCDHCGRDHIGELDEAIHAADIAYAKVFPATTDGPRRPGRLPVDALLTVADEPGPADA
jgi:hypothetical protein